MSIQSNSRDELEVEIANLVIGWSIEVAKMPRGKTVSAWVSKDIMQLVDDYVSNKCLEAEERVFNFWLGAIQDSHITPEDRSWAQLKEEYFSAQLSKQGGGQK